MDVNPKDENTVDNEYAADDAQSHDLEFEEDFGDQRRAESDAEAAAQRDAERDAMQDMAHETAYELGDEEDPLAPTSAGDSIAEQKVIALQEQLDQAKDQMIRAVAEAENTRKRMMKEREDGRKYAISGFAKDLLDFSDNFNRALDSIPAEALEGNELIKNVLSGIEAMEKELLRTFEKHGVQKIEPLDEKFDPNLHEVMFETPIPGKAGGTIIQVIEPGYLLHDRLLRPARVGIAKDDGSGGGANTHHIDTEA